MDNTTENRLLDTVLAQVPRFGLTATLEQREIRIGDGHVDAYVRIGRDRKTRVYAVEVKTGLRPARRISTKHSFMPGSRGHVHSRHYDQRFYLPK